MRSLIDELDEIKEFLKLDEIENTKEAISLYTLHKIIKEEFDDFSKYDSDFQDTALNKLKEDLKKYRGGLFDKNRKFLNKLTPSEFYIIMKNNYNKEWDYRLSLQLKKKFNQLCTWIFLTKKEGIKDINIFFGGDYRFSPIEKARIKNFIIDHYFSDIRLLFCGMEKITKYYRELPEEKLNDIDSELYFRDSKFSQTFKNELFNIKFTTYINGENRANIKLSDEVLNEVLEKDLLCPVGLESFIVINNANIAKRFKVNVDELNPIYKSIVTNSEYYKNLCDVKKLQKK